MIDRASIMAWAEHAPWTDSEFLSDTELLLRPGADKFDPERAFQMVRGVFIERLPGRRR